MTIITLRLAAAAGAMAIAVGCAGPGQGDQRTNPAAPASTAGGPLAAVPGGEGARSGPSAGSLAGGVSAPPASPGAAGMVPGTPAGGLAQWIEEVRSGLRGLPALVKRDPATAKNEALQLYVTRQEYIEIYYGAAGRAVKDAVLAEAVTTAETRFHDLLRVLNPPDGQVAAGAVPGAVDALREQYDRVLQRARALGVDLGRVAPAPGAGS